LRINACNTLLAVLSSPLNHRFISRVDIKNFGQLMMIDGDNGRDFALIGLKLLQKLCGKEEFIGVFKAEKIERFIILLLSR